MCIDRLPVDLTPAKKEIAIKILITGLSYMYVHVCVRKSEMDRYEYLEREEEDSIFKGRKDRSKGSEHEIIWIVRKSF